MPLKVIVESKKQSFKKKIAVAAGKGGVGKSTVSALLAFYCQKLSQQTALLDLDVYGPSLRKMIPSEKNAFTDKFGHHPAITKGLKSLSFADFKEDGASYSIRAPLANQLVEEFLYNAHWGECDILIVDCPPGTSDIHLSLCQKGGLDGVILVTTPQEVSVIDVKKSADFFIKMGVPLIGFIENMGFLNEGNKKIPLYTSGGGSRLSREYGAPLLCELPFLPKLNYFSDCGFNLFDSTDPDFDEIKKGIDQVFKAVQKHRGPFMPKLNVDTPYSFTIDWEGDVRCYDLADLLVECPCANCEKEPHKTKRENVRAEGIKNVGNYALKIDFVEGCRNGIYSFTSLKKKGRGI